MTLLAWLKRSREAYLDGHLDADAFQVRCFSAATYSLWRTCRPLMTEHCRGLALDAGSGRGTWRKIILATAEAYESIDMAPRGNSHPTWTGDVSDMPDVPTARYQTVVCHQVLEHVRFPGRAATEFFRVIAPGGTLIVSVPHLSRRHELPHDYQRFTQEGLHALLSDAGFERVDVRHHGGLFSFIHHQTSFLVPGMLLGIPLLGWLAFLVNAALSWLFDAMDRLVDRHGLMPLGVVAVAYKGRGT
jgi:SAM-dependent methyltransferase